MDDDSGDDVYEVEKIVDNVMVGGKTYYRVRWKNYGEDGDTWEPRENLLSCEALLNNYIRVQSEKTSGLQLPGDVFTVGSEESGSEMEKEKEKFKKKKKVQEKKKKAKNISLTKKTSRKIIEPSESDSSSSDEPQVKDPFWENLKDGKIDVFASDLYSKVKQRRPPEKEVEFSQKESTSEGAKGKKRGPKKKSIELDVCTSTTSVKTMEKDIKQLEKKSEGQEEKNDDSSSDSSNMVLQYLEKELKTKKEKKKVKNSNLKTKNSEPKQKDLSNIQKTVLNEEKEQSIEPKDVTGERRSFMNLFEESEVAMMPEKSMHLGTKTNLKPNVVLQKIKTPEKVDSSALEKEKKTEKLKEFSKHTSALKIKEDDESLTKQEKRKEKNIIETKKAKTHKKSDISESETDSEKPDKNKNGKEAKNKTNRHSSVDSFSAQLQESDFAVTDRLIKKKERSKKHKTGRISSPAQEKMSVLTSGGASVLELLTQEMEKEVTMGTSSVDPKLNQFETAVKDTQMKIGVKSQKGSETKPSWAPDMSEFFKIKVNFDLDEISVKDVERHHEMGEPPCRLERDITNAEFRQYIRSNNFEMVHEALKSKKMMYNLEHTDALWMTQLMFAANAGLDEIVKILAHHGARANARSKIGQTALMFASERGHDIICRILIAYGAYINLQTTSGETALMKASKNGHYMIARYLLQAGADPTSKSSHGTTALEISERAANLQMVNLIKDHESNINAHVNECIHRECHSLGIRTIGLPILAARVFNIRETPMVHVTFNCVLQNIPPHQGLLIFAVHGMIGSGLSIKCRLRGPCYVNATTLNNFVMDPLMPGKLATDEYNHFMTNLIWKPGQNSLRLFVSQDALSNEKLFVSIFQCGFEE